MARKLDTLQKQYNSKVETGGRGPMAATNSFKGKPKNSKATVKRILSYLGSSRHLLILVYLFMLLSTVTMLASGYVLRPVINGIADSSTPAEQRLSYLAHMLILLTVIYLVTVVFTWLRSKLMIGISRTAIQNIRDDLFTKLEKLPLRFHDNQTTGELMSRFTNDVDNIGMMLDQSLMSLVSGVINLVGTLAMMIYTNIWLTLITLVFIPIFALGGRVIINKSRKYYSAQQAALGAANGYIEESVAGQKVVKVFNHESECVEEFGLLNGDLRGKQESVSVPVTFTASCGNAAVATAAVRGSLESSEIATSTSCVADVSSGLGSNA